LCLDNGGGGGIIQAFFESDLVRLRRKDQTTYHLKGEQAQRNYKLIQNHWIDCASPMSSSAILSLDKALAEW